MSDRTTLVEQYRTRFETCREDLDALADRIECRQNQGLSDLDREIVELRAARDDVERRLRELDAADDQTWEGLRQMVEDALGAVHKGIEGMKSSLDKD